MKQSKQSKPEPMALGTGGAPPPSLAELRAIRLAQRATNQRVEELKMRLFRMTEQHMDQAVSLIRRWMDNEKK